LRLSIPIKLILMNVDNICTWIYGHCCIMKTELALCADSSCAFVLRFV
jgi:hypothetical protein